MSELTFAHRNIKSAISLNSCLADYTSAFFAYLSEQHQPLLEMKVSLLRWMILLQKSDIPFILITS